MKICRTPSLSPMYARRVPSGDQVRRVPRAMSVTFRAPPPSAFITHASALRSRCRVNATSFPSGERSGRMSHCEPLTSVVADRSPGL